MRASFFAVFVVSAFFVGRASSGPVQSLEASPLDCPTKLRTVESSLEICERAIAVIDSATERVKSQPATTRSAVASKQRPISPGQFRVTYARIGKLVSELDARDPVTAADLKNQFGRIDLLSSLTHSEKRGPDYAAMTTIGVKAKAALARAATIAAETSATR